RSECDGHHILPGSGSLRSRSTLVVKIQQGSHIDGRKAGIFSRVCVRALRIGRDDCALLDGRSRVLVGFCRELGIPRKLTAPYRHHVVLAPDTMSGAPQRGSSMMKKTFTALVAAAAMAGTMTMTATDASAQRWLGPAIVGGVIGGAVMGSILA